MTVKASAPDLEKRDSDQKYAALAAYIDNIKDEVNLCFSLIQKQLKALGSEIEILKGGLS